MDWPRARSILLAAFTVVNLLLAYTLWGPDGKFPAFSGAATRAQGEQLRLRLAERGLVLQPGTQLPNTPPPMGFLRVEYHPDLILGQFPHASSTAEHGGTLDPATRAIIYKPNATGPAARTVKIENKAQVRLAAEEYLQSQSLLPADGVFSHVILREDGRTMVEFVPQFQGLLVYSGYLRVYLSARGIEEVVKFWVTPIGYKEAQPKAVRPVAEALLRLAGHLEQSGGGTRTVTDIRLGYYSGLSVTEPMADGIDSWETVPVWHITLDNGLEYYINAFNGELES